MRSAYRWLAHAVALGVVLQAASVAYGWFAVISALEDGGVFDANSQPNIGHELHGMIGMYVLPLLGLVLLVVSFFAKVPRGVRWAAIVFGLVVLQVALGLFGFGVPALGALHGVTAMVLFGVASHAAHRTREHRAPGLPRERAGATL
jgi:heme A synthase